MNSMVAVRPERSRTESRAHTRRRLLDMGRQAFARKGLAGTNLKDDILVPAAVSVGSFYHQFRDKTDLFVAILEEHSETFRAMIRAAHSPGAGDSPMDVARHSFETVFGVADANDDLFRIMFRERESDEPRVRSYLRDNHRRWVESLADDYQRAGLIAAHAGALARLAAQLISALTAGAVLNYLDQTPAERARMRHRLIEGLVRFVLGGVPGLVAGAGGRRRVAVPSRRKKGAP
jgi:AcrR family transcriptional regulator